MGRFAARNGFADYEALQRWSVSDLEGFWQAVWDFYAIKAHTPPERVLGRRDMPGAEWFPGATLNYAEHMLHASDAVAVVVPGGRELTFNQLREAVARTRAGLQELGVEQGDRVVAYLPNRPETLIAFLATASLGAIWASVSPEFGARSVVDRFAQIEPKLLLAVDGYTHRGEWIDRGAELRGDPRRAADARAHAARAAVRARRARVRPGRVRPPALRALLVRDDRAAEADRARARRHPARARQEPRARLGPQARRAADGLHHDRVDDVERARLGAALRGLGRADGGRSRAPVGGRRRDAADAHGRQPGVPDGVPQGRHATARAAGAARAGHRGLAAARRGLRVRLRAARPGRPADQRQRRHRRLQRDRLRRARCCPCTRARSPAAAWASTPRPSTPRAARSSASWASS